MRISGSSCDARRSASGCFVEGDSDGATTAMGADDRADLADQDVTVVVGPEHLDKDIYVGAVSMQHSEVLDPTVVAAETLDQMLQCLGTGPLLARFGYDTTGDVDDRLDR